MLFLFILIIIVGSILFFAAVAFYNTQDIRRCKIDNRERYYKQGTDSRDKGEEGYIPVVNVERPVPGRAPHELIHYMGSGMLFAVETLSDPKEVVVDEKTLTSELEGDIALTSRNILIYNEKNTKKIPISNIEKIHFDDPYVIIKRKRVKKKKDILKILTDPSEFRYILNTLT